MSVRFFCDACGVEIKGSIPLNFSPPHRPDDQYELCDSCGRKTANAALLKMKEIQRQHHPED